MELQGEYPDSVGRGSVIAIGIAVIIDSIQIGFVVMFDRKDIREDEEVLVYMEDDIYDRKGV